MDYVSAFISMLIILGTFENILIFNNILDSFKFDMNKKKKTIKDAYIIAYLVWLPFFFFGTYFLLFFGINLPSFAIAGGIFLFYIGIEILIRDVPSYARLENVNEEGIAITPLAIPLLTGPGVITTTLIYRSYNLSLITLFFSFSLAFLISFIITYYGIQALGKINEKYLIVINRFMGLILLAIAIEILLNGIHLIVTT